MLNDDPQAGRVLVVEDDEAIADVLRRTLRQEGHEVRSSVDGVEALRAAEEFVPDLVILDLGLPGLDGVEVCRRLRAESDVPILILTARSELDDRVEGLDSGADDYLSKPFERQELLARMRALMRRRPPRGSAALVVGDLRLNPDTREVHRGERPIELTNREFELLEYLMRNARLVVSRERLLEEVWGYDPLAMTNTIDVFISNLRRKLEEGGEVRLLHTKRGAGYVIRAATVMAERVARRLPISIKHWPVRWRLAGVSAGLTLLILVVFALVVGRLATERVKDDFQQELQSAASQLRNQIQLQGVGITAPAGPNVLDLLMAGDAALRIVDFNGRVISRNGTPQQTAGAPDMGAPEPDQVTKVGNYEVFSLPLSASSIPPTYLQYARDREPLEATLSKLWLFLGIGVVGGTALAALAGLAVAGRAMRPISSLTTAAREIATTRDPSRRIPMPESDDEVAELARTLEQMLRELDAARSETEAMIQAQRDFVADASHELRTPLTSILANLELLEASFADRGADPDEQEIVAGALGSSRRMRRLVADLLLLARADAGRTGPRRRCDLAEVAATAVAEVRPMSEDHAIELAAASEVEVEGNPDDLHRLVVNLVENGVRHTPSGSTISVAVRHGEQRPRCDRGRRRRSRAPRGRRRPDLRPLRARQRPG